MREIQYRSFSWNTHKKNWRINRPNLCQFELTFRCALHCRHCYSDCYNKLTYLKKELNTKEVRLILDGVYRAGIIWLCFTGGDPLAHKDFLDIYSYVKDKGFIIIVFTSGYLLNEEIVKYFKRKPPFVIELTLNAITEDLYERIAQVEGSFRKVMEGLDLILKAKLPLKIKTQVTQDNLEELTQIKKFIENLGLKFRPSYLLYPRLNGDLTPCNLRISPQEILNLNGNRRSLDDDCRLLPITDYPASPAGRRLPITDLFPCAIGGGDGIYIDPYGNVFLCNLIRKPSFNLLKLKIDIKYAQEQLLSLVRERKFITSSKCRNCNLRSFCMICPGKAYLETGDEEAPLEYYCRLTKETLK